MRTIALMAQSRRTPSRMATISNGHNPEWTPSQMDTISNGHHLKWTPSQMAQSQMGTTPNEHHPE